MNNKLNKIWYRYNHDEKKLKEECVDILSKCYMMLGQKPDPNQIVLMAKFLFDDLVKYYSNFTMDEVQFILEQGIKHSDNGGFINVRNWNQWIKEYKTKSALKRQNKMLTDYEKEQKTLEIISNYIENVKDNVKQIKD